MKALAEAQTKELEQFDKEWELLRNQLDSLVAFSLMNEGDYRALPRELRDMITVGMGGAALRELLEGIDLVKLIADLTTEANETTPFARKHGASRHKARKHLPVGSTGDTSGPSSNGTAHGWTVCHQ